MIAISAFAALIGLISGALAFFDPQGDRARLAAARRELRDQGLHYEKGSEEEARALRVLLEGDSLQSA